MADSPPSEGSESNEYDRVVPVAVALTELIQALARSGHLDAKALADRLKDYEVIMLRGRGEGGKLMSTIRTSITPKPEGEP